MLKLKQINITSFQTSVEFLSWHWQQKKVFYAQKFEEGYDLTDPKYEVWLSSFPCWNYK